jgi:hypothetical protein
MNLLERRDHEIKAARAIVDGAKRQARDLSAPEASDVQAHLDAATELSGQIKSAEVTADALQRLAANPPGTGAVTDGHSYLSFKSGDLAARVVAKIGGPVGGAKALLTAGVAVTDVPMVGVIPTGRPAANLLEVLPSRIVPPQWRYLQQSVRTNNAAPVTPGGTKPTSVITLIEQTGQLSVIAHLSEPIDNFALIDNGAVRDFVSSEMQFGLYAALEGQLLAGSGTPPNLRGLLNTSGIQTYATAASYTPAKGIAGLRHAITLLEQSGYDATSGFIAMTPQDWEVLELATSSTGEYQFTPAGQAPVDRVQRRLYGLPVVTSPRMTAGVVLVVSADAAFAMSDGRVAVEANPFTGFATNETTLRCEGRFSLAVPRPLGVVKVTLTA